MERFNSNVDIDVSAQSPDFDPLEERDDMLEKGFAYFRRVKEEALIRGCDISDIVLANWSRFIQLNPNPQVTLEQKEISKLDEENDPYDGIENSNIRVIFIDTPSLITDGIQLVLEGAGMKVIGIIDNKEDAVNKARELLPNLIITESQLSNGTNGVKVVNAIHEAIGDIPVVFLTNEDDSLADAVEAGAYGFLSKSQDAGAVIRTVKKVAHGEFAIPAEKLAERLREDERQRELSKSRMLAEPLTSREQEVLELMSRGLDNRSISKKLIVSYTTVRTYVQFILEKLGAHSKLEAVAKANEYGLLDRNGQQNGKNGQSQ